MFSILVPIYNFNSVELINSLHQQCLSSGKSFEIICLDDGSNQEFKNQNSAIKNLNFVRYEELPNNIGRAAIRNLLAQKAKYSQLLFLDCDVEICNDKFVSNYLAVIDKKVVIGGICYNAEPPKNSSYILRWKYGIEREQLSAQQRSESTFGHFLASNLWINKELFIDVSNSISLKGYGHEDTWLGFQIREKQVEITHIDNPIKHIGLDSSQDFLEKSLSGIKNLIQLYQLGKIDKNTKLIRVYEKLKAYRLLGIYSFLLGVFISKIEGNLNSSNPKLHWFDQWKLYHLIKFQHRQ